RDGDPVLQMSVNLDHGVSRKNLEDTFDWWAKIVPEFRHKVLE
ncbi:YbjN domain-containing protein, partial [Leptothrix ochracea]